LPLDDTQAQAKVRELLEYRSMERTRLDRLHSYLRATYNFRWLSAGVPDEVKRISEISRVNVIRFIINSPVQSMFVDGFRSPKAETDEPGWDLWQRNRMDARQIGIHRAALAYGASYATVLPGKPVPVIRGASPRRMTVVYGDDDDWPEYALEKRRSIATAEGTERKTLWRLFDKECVYWITGSEGSNQFSLEKTDLHGAGVTPVIRYLSDEDLDEEVIGEIEPHIPLQDQINMTTFGLLVAQHYGAFKQRYILGWIAASEEQRLKTEASKLWTFEDTPDNVQVGEFDQTDLKGYIESRESTVRFLSTLSQTPVHELLGTVANLSAEALVAARDSANRADTEKKTLIGERHEQMLTLGAQLQGKKTDAKAWVRWRDMEPRSLAQAADALGKLAQMLGVPQEELWERVPGVMQQEVERWKEAAKKEAATVPPAPPGNEE
jgi:hypothetical protein